MYGTYYVCQLLEDFSLKYIVTFPKDFFFQVNFWVKYKRHVSWFKISRHFLNFLLVIWWILIFWTVQTYIPEMEHEDEDLYCWELTAKLLITLISICIIGFGTHRHACMHHQSKNQLVNCISLNACSGWLRVVINTVLLAYPGLYIFEAWTI